MAGLALAGLLAMTALGAAATHATVFSGSDLVGDTQAITRGESRTAGQALLATGSSTDGELPSNEFSFGRVERNTKIGTAKLTVRVPGPGQLELARTKKVKADTEYAEFPQGEIPDTYGENLAGTETLSVKPRRKAKRRLNLSGQAKVKAKVTYTPDGGEPNTKSKKLKLKKR